MKRNPASSDPAARATPAESDAGLDGLVETLDRAGRAYDRVLVGWLMDADLPLLSAGVLLLLDPEDAPMSVGEVAEAIGISTEDAARALHDLRSLGYAREEKRLYEPTGEGIQLHASLESARRQALRASLSSLGADERRELAEALSKLPQRYPCVKGQVKHLGEESGSATDRVE